jgi:CCR4-NOT transcriptional regulation complex NOT5 subunit
MDLSKVFAEHDETLLYIFYTMPGKDIQTRSAQELGRRGWLYNDSDELWYVTRKGPSKGKSDRSKSRGTSKNEDNTELRSFKFDIDQWSLVEFNLPEDQQ